MPNKPRPFWMLGKILEIIIGFDDKIRSVKLLQGNGQVVHHSIWHLYPLELSITLSGKNQQVFEGTEINTAENVKDCEIFNDVDTNGETDVEHKSRRLPRLAATKFIKILKYSFSLL